MHIAHNNNAHNSTQWEGKISQQQEIKRENAKSHCMKCRLM